jgi:hypothetical protein
MTDTTLDLDGYFERIDYRGAAEPTLDVLTAVGATMLSPGRQQEEFAMDTSRTVNKVVVEALLSGGLAVAVFRFAPRVA